MAKIQKYAEDFFGYEYPDITKDNVDYEGK